MPDVALLDLDDHLRGHRRHHIEEAIVLLLIVVVFSMATARLVRETSSVKANASAKVAAVQRELQGVRDFVGAVPGLLAQVQAAAATDIGAVRDVVASLAATVTSLPTMLASVLRTVNASLQSAVSAALAKVTATGTALIRQVADLNIRSTTDIEVHVVRPLVADVVDLIDQLLAGLRAA